MQTQPPMDARSGHARELDYSMPFLPAGLSLADEAAFLAPGDRRTLSQVQARTHAATAGVLERVTGAALLGARAERPGVEALLLAAGAKVRRRERLRELEAAMARDMPPGHAARTGAFAQRALRAGPWASMALALLHEHSRLAHAQAYEVAREPSCPSWRHAIAARDDASHEVVVAREFARVQAALEPARRDAALDEFLELVSMLHAALAAQARADARHFIEQAAVRCAPGHEGALSALLARAYRWQFLAAGALEPGFRQPLHSLLDAAQSARVRDAFSATAVTANAARRLAIAA